MYLAYDCGIINLQVKYGNIQVSISRKIIPVLKCFELDIIGTGMTTDMVIFSM